MKQRYIVLIFAIILILIFYGNLSLQPKPLSISYVNIYLQISNSSSSDIQGETIYFSSPPGRAIQGNTIVTNNENKQEKIKITLEGELALNGWIKIEQDRFNLEQGEQKSIGLLLLVPPNALGNYSGKLKIESK